MKESGTLNLDNGKFILEFDKPILSSMVNAVNPFHTSSIIVAYIKGNKLIVNSISITGNNAGEVDATDNRAFNYMVTLSK